MQVLSWKDTIIRYMGPSLEATTLFQLCLPIGLYLGITSGAGWYWWLIAFFFYGIVYSMIGNNIALHRYFTHGHMTVTKSVEWFWVWCGSMIGLGDPVSFAATHIVHHNPKYTDTKMDPHGPIRGIKSVLYYFQKPINVKETPVMNRFFVKLSRKWGWLHRFYIPFLLVNATILYLISYEVFLFCWFIPASLSLWGISISILRQHWNLKANNCKTHRYEILYEGLHLNHHLYPQSPNCAVNPGEIDWTYQFSRLFRPKYNEINKT